MSRNTSLEFRKAVYSQETGEAVLILIEISHDDLSNPIRLSSDSVDTIHDSEIYSSFPFRIVLPSDGDDQVTEARLSIDGIDRSIISAVRSISTPPSVIIRVVLGSDPEVIEAEFPGFKLYNVTYNSLVVEATLGVVDFSQEPYPGGRFTPVDFPGMF